MHSSKSSIYYTTTGTTITGTTVIFNKLFRLLPSDDPCDDSFRMGGADDSEYVSSLGGGVVSGIRQLHLYSSSIYSIDRVRVCESLYIGSSDNIRNSCSGSSIDRER